MQTVLSSSFVSLRGRLLFAAALASVGLSITLPTPALAQIYTGDLNLPNQTAVDAFHYTEVTGNLSIGNSTPFITDLSSLSTLTRVRGNLIIHAGESLQNIDGLASLRSVGGDLQFLSNLALQNVDGLSALTEVGGSLHFFNSPALKSLYGLSSLATVGGSVDFSYSIAPGVKGAIPLTTIGGGLYFIEVRLESLDGLFPKLTTIGSFLTFLRVTGLRNLDALSTLTSVGGVHLKEDVELENINGLSSLTTVGGGLDIIYLPKIADLKGLSAVTSVGGDVTIQYNSLQENYCGLWGLLSAGGPGGKVNIAFNAANPTVEDIMADGPCVVDTDGDGVPDDQDTCASSDLRTTVWVLNCDTAVSNRVGSNGCSLADRVAAIVAQAAVSARNHGQFVSRSAQELNAFVTTGVITQAEKEALMSCVGSSRLP